jgi:glycosyltransferase involved in cell wall biosynthesis
MLALITHLAALHPETAFVYYVSRTNIERDDLERKLADCSNLAIRPIASPVQVTPVPEDEPAPRPRRDAAVGVLKSVPGLHKVLRSCYIFARNILRPQPTAWWEYGMADDVLAELDGFDVVYLGWPYYIQPARVTAAVVATFHDLHFKHFPESYTRGQLRVLDTGTAEWLRRCRTVVASTRFIEEDVRAYYPDTSAPVEIVYLASYGFHAPEAGAIEATVERLALKRPFALYSGGRSGHKNVARILEAIGILKQQSVGVQLVITGAGTDVIGLPTDAQPRDAIHAMNAVIERYGLVRGEDYVPLGYVTNADVDALTAGADLVISASLYEAGCGPAMDAWLTGVPVVLSNIPPFLEQIGRFGVQAWVIDPLDAHDIADKIQSAIQDRVRSSEMVAASRHAFEQYGWDDVAREYYRVFEQAAAAGPTSRALEPAPSLSRFWLNRATAGWWE